MCRCVARHLPRCTRDTVLSVKTDRCRRSLIKWLIKWLFNRTLVMGSVFFRISICNVNTKWTMHRSTLSLKAHISKYCIFSLKPMPGRREFLGCVHPPPSSNLKNRSITPSQGYAYLRVIYPASRFHSKIQKTCPTHGRFRPSTALGGW